MGISGEKLCGKSETEIRMKGFDDGQGEVTGNIIRIWILTAIIKKINNI